MYWISGTTLIIQVVLLGRIMYECSILSFLLSFLSADKEYLHKDRDGNVFLYNAETREESLYLSNSTFVIYRYIYIYSNMNVEHSFVNAE